ncbi:unnamed protein product [Periconia digitata]|uniref:DUF6536 domain-containing protein n=1 Tax=Periconia digitata TaxID=1303443 RepID=A0A9W4U9D5_9PLEO|nr:unnamed protein product [Periconia digitata]
MQTDAEHEDSLETSKFLPPTQSPLKQRRDFLPSKIRSWIDFLNSDTDKFRVASSACAACAFLIFLINVSIFVWATGHRGWPATGRQWLFRGNCEKTARLNSWFHFFINVISTLLLSFSGYCMQFLSAPTSLEVSRAHARGRWLHIGTLSMRNFRDISVKRSWMWVALVVTSLGLQLSYNSMIFMTDTTNEYWPIQVSSAFANNSSAPFSYDPSFENAALFSEQRVLPGWREKFTVQKQTFETEVERLRSLLEKHELERLEPMDCIRAFNVKYQTSYGSVLLVSNNSTSVVHNQCDWVCLDGMNGCEVCYPRYSSSWMCPGVEETLGGCLPFAQELLGNATRWKPGDVLDGSLTTRYCLAERKEATCMLQTNPYVGIIVITMTLVKAVVMFLVSRQYTGCSLVTVGDAIRYFLETPDPYTTKMCLASYRDFQKMRKEWNLTPKKYTPTHFRCCLPGGRLQWASSIILCAVPIGFGFYWFDSKGAFDKGSTIISLGLGPASNFAPDITQFADSIRLSNDKTHSKDLLSRIFMANIPQIWLAALKLLTNGFITGICTELEWASYADRRKGLRVSSNRRDSQRSTYFLQLPYRFSIPLLVVFGILHWLASQSFFVADDDVGATLGISPLGCVISLAILAVIMVYLVVQGLWTVHIQMPLMGSCSAVIAAACQPRDDVEMKEAHSKPVQWGVVCEPMYSGIDEISHCGFSHEYVDIPVGGRVYL